MTSEPDSTPRRRPPTIDLTAKEVEQPASTTEAEAAEPSPDRAEKEAPPGARARRSFFQAVGGPGVLVIGALVGIGIGAATTLAIVRAPGAPPAAPPVLETPLPRTDAAEAVAIKELSARLDKIETGLAAPRPDAALASRMTAAEAATKSLGDSLAALNRRLDDVAVTAGGALAHADAAATTADAAKSGLQQSGLQRGDLDALANRMTALERSVKTLADDVARHAASADDRAARMTVAAEALRQAVERGAPYEAELAAVKSLGAEKTALAPLEAAAPTGAPTAVALARELSALTPALRRAVAPASDQSTFLGRLEANAHKLVRVTPIDAPRGDDADAAVARVDAAAARGDIAAALAELRPLPDSARAIAASWVKQAEEREAAIAASRRIAADALAALGRPPPQ